MKFVQIIEKYRKIAFSERDKRARFERIIQANLQTGLHIDNDERKYIC